ncbi:MAG: hypothetical protein RL235_263 [Chlamydiota bacterium]|jgi:predicted DCC family thiol-disulfide oxidoreductase YuxK
MGRHLVLFDADCPLCRGVVKELIELDEEALFLFAPLEGETADSILVGPQAWLKNTNSLVLVEHFTSTDRLFSIRSKAIFRIYWLIGGRWKIIGMWSCLPAWLIDPIYRWVAEHRHQFKFSSTEPLGPSARFLP